MNAATYGKLVNGEIEYSSTSTDSKTYQIGDTVKYLTISNEIRTARITDFGTEDGEETFTAECIDLGNEDIELMVWGFVSDIIEIVKAVAEPLVGDVIVINRHEYTVEDIARNVDSTIDGQHHFHKLILSRKHSSAMFRTRYCTMGWYSGNVTRI